MLQETYEKITPSERDATFRVPRSAPKERASIGQEILLYTPIEDNGIQWSLRSGSNLMPLVHCCGGVNCDVLRLGLLPAALSVREKFVNDSGVMAVDPSTTVSVT